MKTPAPTIRTPPGKPEHAHHRIVGPQAPKRKDPGVLLADPLALDPYSPILPARAPADRCVPARRLDP